MYMMSFLAWKFQIINAENKVSSDPLTTSDHEYCSTVQFATSYSDWVQIEESADIEHLVPTVYKSMTYTEFIQRKKVCKHPAETIMDNLATQLPDFMIKPACNVVLHVHRMLNSSTEADSAEWADSAESLDISG